MKTDGKGLSRKEFLVMMGSGLLAFVFFRLSGLTELFSSSSPKRSRSASAYGNAAYGGRAS